MNHLMWLSPRNPSRVLASLAFSLAAAGCMAPAISPVHPMSALPPGAAAALGGESKLDGMGALGYAPAPGAGLGQSVIPGTPYAEGELRYTVAERVQLLGSLEASFQHYLLPWPSSLELGVKLTLLEDPAFAVAIAPRVVGASSFIVLPGSGVAVFGTSDIGGELPLIITHQFSNQMALTLQVWGRGFYLHQEDAAGADSSDSSLPATQPTVDTGRCWAAGGALVFSFPKIRHSPTSYQVFFGGEQLWMTQTSTNLVDPEAFNPLVTVNRFSLLAGIATTTPF
jgi:hypothetical protein